MAFLLALACSVVSVYHICCMQYTHTYVVHHPVWYAEGANSWNAYNARGTLFPDQQDVLTPIGPSLDVCTKTDCPHTCIRTYIHYIRVYVHMTIHTYIHTYIWYEYVHQTATHVVNMPIYPVTQVYALPQRNRSASMKYPVANWKMVDVACESTAHSTHCLLYLNGRLTPTQMPPS